MIHVTLHILTIHHHIFTDAIVSLISLQFYNHVIIVLTNREALETSKKNENQLNCDANLVAFISGLVVSKGQVDKI